MNTLIANQYGQVQGEVAGPSLRLLVDAETPRHDSVHVTLTLDSSSDLLYLLAILGAVKRRIGQFQVKEPEASQELEGLASEPELFDTEPSSRNKIYGRFPSFLVYEQFDEERLRLFFSARDDQNHIARFDLKAGEVEAFRTLAERALLTAAIIKVPFQDELSLAVNCTASTSGLTFGVQTPGWRSEFRVSKAHHLATLAVFIDRALDQVHVTAIHFEDGPATLALRRKVDGKIHLEFRLGDSREQLRLPALHVYELEVLARYALCRSFEPELAVAPNDVEKQVGVSR